MKSNLELLKGLAAEHVKKFPQYAGHFDSYVLVRVKKAVKTKMGLAFDAGEVAIAFPTARGPVVVWETVDYRSVWSFKNGIDTSVRESDIEVL